MASTCSSGSKCRSANPCAAAKFARHWLRTQRDLNHRGDGQNAFRGSMDIGSSSDRGGLAYWVHVWRPALTKPRDCGAASICFHSDTCAGFFRFRNATISAAAGGQL